MNGAPTGIETDADEHLRGLRAAIMRMEQTPDSGIAMCHRQGKTAVYLSDDKTHIVKHPPHGTIKKIPLKAEGSACAGSESSQGR